MIIQLFSSLKRLYSSTDLPNIEENTTKKVKCVSFSNNVCVYIVSRYNIET